MTETRHIPLAAIMAQLEQLPGDARFTYPVRHGTMRAGVYAPQDTDDQTPHVQDELYIIAAGSGCFVHNGRRAAFAAGDLLFVKAGEPHRFEDFTPDFATWVVFWGPKGGEGR